MPVAPNGGRRALTEPLPPDQVDAGRQEDRLAGEPTTRWDVLAAVGFAVVVMAIGIVWRSPIVPTDPWHYVQRALTFPDSVWIPLGFTRYGIILANIIPTRLFGNAEASYYFWTVISAGMLAAVVYLMGRRWWGRTAGVVAVVVLFTNSIVFYNLTRQYPDIMSITLVMVAAWCALMARDRDLCGRAGVLWVLSSGFFLGWSFEVRETALFAWPLVIAILWRGGGGLRAMGLALLPVLGWAALDVSISAVAYGDPFLKLHVLTGFGGGRAPVDAAEATRVAANTRWDWFLAIPRHALRTRPDGLWMVVSGALAALAVLVRNSPLRLVSLSFIAMYGLNLAFGGMLLPDKPFGDLYNIRYWIQFVPLIALAVGGLAELAVRWILARTGWRGVSAVLVSVAVGMGAVTAPVFAAVRSVPTIEAFAVNGGDALEEVRSYAAAQSLDVGTVWTDSRTARLLPIFQRGVFGGDDEWSGRVKKFPKDPADMKSGDLVLLYSANDVTCYHCRIQVRPWLKSHPGVENSWDPIFSTASGNAVIYQVR